jgi:hypothetical protein
MVTFFRSPIMIEPSPRHCLRILIDPDGSTSDDEVHEVRKVSELLYSIRNPLSRARAGFAINEVKDIYTLI